MWPRSCINWPPGQASNPTFEADAIAGALLGDVGSLLAHRSSSTADDDPVNAVLVAGLIDRLPGLGGAAAALRHRHERWDGTGTPHGLDSLRIPEAARLLAVASRLVGRTRPGDLPGITARLVDALGRAGAELDPVLVDHAIDAFRTGSGAVDDVTVDSVLALLDELIAKRRSLASPVESLLNIGAAIEAADRIDDVLFLIADNARAALGSSTVSIGRFDDHDGSVDVLVNVGELGPGGERFPAAESYLLHHHPHLKVLLAGLSLARRASDPIDPDTAEELVERGLASEIAAPILMGDRAWGVVWATTRTGHRELGEHDVETLRLVASLVASGVSQAERFAELEELALRDPLTGLGNRRVLEATLREVFARPPIERQDTAVIMCDVDGLKFVNDNLGHEIGDLLLAEVGITLRQAVVDHPNTTVCRIGGDEFCIVVDGGGLLSGPAIARRAVELFERTGEDRSLSVGVAVATFEMESPSDLLRAADENQYENKRTRRSVFVIEAGDDTAPAGRPVRRRRRDTT